MSKIEIYRAVLIVVEQNVIKSGGTLSIRHIASLSTEVGTLTGLRKTSQQNCMCVGEVRERLHSPSFY